MRAVAFNNLHPDKQSPRDATAHVYAGDHIMYQYACMCVCGWFEGLINQPVTDELKLA